jgi:hypothetical protein
LTIVPGVNANVLLRPNAGVGSAPQEITETEMNLHKAF